MQLRRAAKVLIRRQQDGKYLMVWSSEWEGNPARSHQPDLPGGIVEPDESQVAGLLREMSEEVGFVVDESRLQLAYAVTFDYEGISSVFEVYAAEVASDPPITLSWEHERYDWLTAEEILALEIRHPYPSIFAHMQRVGLLT